MANVTIKATVSATPVITATTANTDVTTSAGVRGANGSTILNGSGAPSENLGAIGDYYIDNTNYVIYGAKTSSGWGDGSSIVGPQGESGDGSGDMLKSMYDPNIVRGDSFDMDNMAEGSTNLILTPTERSKLAGIEDGAEVNTVNSVNEKTGDITLDKDDIGLSNVDNTADLDKPVSTATLAALSGKVNGTTKITVSPTPPPSPSIGDLWVDTSA